MLLLAAVLLLAVVLLASAVEVRAGSRRLSRIRLIVGTWSARAAAAGGAPYWYVLGSTCSDGSSSRRADWVIAAAHCDVLETELFLVVVVVVVVVVVQWYGEH
eukprot:COSAG02_NODE_17947_length_969_cov_3.002809_2_plen_102_part_01